MVSQYRSSELDVCEYGGIDYCKMYGGKTLGEYSLGLYDVPDDPKWVMLGIVFLATMYGVSMFLSYIMLEYYRHEYSPSQPPPLPASLSETTIPTPRQPKESYAIRVAGERHGCFPGDRNDIAVLGEDDDMNDSVYASQGVRTNTEDIMDLRYSITVPADAVVDPAGQRGVEGAPGRPVAVDSRDNTGKSKETPQASLPMKVWPAAMKNPRLQQLDASLNSSVSSELSRQQRDETFDFVAAYRSSRIKQRLDAKRAAPGVFMPSDRLPPVTFAQRRAASDGLQFTMLMRRFLRLYWRTPFYTFTRMATALTLGLMFGLVYSGSNDFTTYQGANGAVGLIFFSTCFLGVGAYVHVLPVAFEERGPYYRERASETYSALWYFVASSVVEIPYAAVASLIFVSVFYPMAGFSAYGDFAQVVVYWLVLTMHILFQTFFGQFFTFAMPSIELAAVWGALFDSIFLMFMGYNPPASSIPDGYKWLFRLVPHRYTFEVLTALVLGDCPDEQLQQIADAAATNTTITSRTGRWAANR
ncbi:ABC-2 type transporter [Phytophthora cactorum]|nr:ABC-2 type transporter [Phytophthora cactorum]